MKLSISKVNLKASQFSTLPQNPAEHSRYSNTETHHHTGAKAQARTGDKWTTEKRPRREGRAGQPGWFICVSVSTAVSERRRRTLKFIQSAMLF